VISRSLYTAHRKPQTVHRTPQRRHLWTGTRLEADRFRDLFTQVDPALPQVFVLSYCASSYMSHRLVRIVLVVTCHALVHRCSVYAKPGRRTQVEVVVLRVTKSNQSTNNVNKGFRKLSVSGCCSWSCSYVRIADAFLPFM